MRCHPDRPYRGMNMKQKPKPKVLRVQEASNWDHIADEVTRAALILMEMSGLSVERIVDCMKKSCKEAEEVGKARSGVNSLPVDAEKEFAKLEMPLLDLNLALPVEY